MQVPRGACLSVEGGEQELAPRRPPPEVTSKHSFDRNALSRLPMPGISNSLRSLPGSWRPDRLPRSRNRKACE